MIRRQQSTFLWPLLLAASVALVASDAQAATGGPDAGGYTWADQDEPFVDANFPPFIGSMDQIIVTDGGPMTDEIPLGGIDFPFYGILYATFRASDNGWITLEPTYTGSTQPTPLILPNAGAPPMLIAPLWGDLGPAFPVNAFWYRPFEGGVMLRYTAKLSGSEDNVQFALGLYESGVIKIHYEVMTRPDELAVGIQESVTPIHALQPSYLGTGDFTLAEDAVLMFFPPAKLGCGSAQTLRCGATLATTSPPAVTPNVTQYGCTTNRYDGREQVLALDLTQLSNVSLSLNIPPPQDIDLDLMVIAEGECNEHHCLAWGEAATVDDTLELAFLPPGHYNVVVDGKTALDNGSFEVTANCEPKGMVLPCGSPTVARETMGASVWDTYGCTTESLTGPEYAFEVDISGPGGKLLAQLSNHGSAQHDLVILPADKMHPEDCLTYGDEEAVLFDPAPGKYMVLVDGRDGAAGPFNLTVSCETTLDCGTVAAPVECQSPLSGTTTGKANNVSLYSCSADRLDGPETVHRFTHPGGPLSLVLDGPPDLEMILTGSDCNEGTCIASGNPLTVGDLPAGDYFVVVDGVSGAAGDYQITPICHTSLTPERLEATLQPGGCTTESKTVFLSTEVGRVDLLFAVDSSAGQATIFPKLDGMVDKIVTEIQAPGLDLGYGLISFVDYVSPFGAQPCGDAAYGVDFDYPYRLEQRITTNRAQLTTALGALLAEDGGDLAESYSRAWYETYSDAAIGWRTNATKVVIMTGDDVPHDCDVKSCLVMPPPTLEWGTDPGRNRVLGDSDDLAIMEVMPAVGDNHVLPIFLYTNVGNPSRPDGLTMWDIWYLWGCWTGEGGGIAVRAGFGQLGVEGVTAIGDAIRDAATGCQDMSLAASPGYASWLRSVTPASHSDVHAPGSAAFDLEICVPPATPQGTYDFDVNLICDENLLTHQDVTVAVSSCLFGPQPPLVTGGDCPGETRTFDGSNSTVAPCSGPKEYRWLDALRTPVPGAAGSWSTTNNRFSIVLEFNTTYILQFRCQNQAECLGFGEVSVPVTVSRPRANAGDNLATCVDQTVSLGTECDLANTYSWAPTTDILDPTACPASLTPRSIPTPNPWIDYTVTVTDPLGCTAMDTVRVTIGSGRTPAFVDNNLKASRDVNDVELDWTLKPLTPREYNIHRTDTKQNLELAVLGGFQYGSMVDAEIWRDVGAVPSTAGNLFFYQVFLQDCDGSSILTP